MADNKNGNPSNAKDCILVNGEWCCLVDTRKGPVVGGECRSCEEGKPATKFHEGSMEKGGYGGTLFCASCYDLLQKAGLTEPEPECTICDQGKPTTHEFTGEGTSTRMGTKRVCKTCYDLLTNCQ